MAFNILDGVGICQNLCVAALFRTFSPKMRTIDQRGQKYTFLERSLHWKFRNFEIRAIGATTKTIAAEA